MSGIEFLERRRCRRDVGDYERLWVSPFTERGTLFDVIRMEFLHIYLLATAGIFCAFGVLVSKVSSKRSVLETGKDNILQAYLKKKEHELDRSRTNITLQEYFLLKIGCPAVLAAAAYFITPDRSLMLLFIAFGFMVPNLVITIRKGNEDKNFTDRYVRALAQMASSLHAGLTVQQSVESVVTCELLHETIREDFKILLAKLKLGTPVDKAFYEFAEITGNKDAYDTAAAIDIMINVGGDAGVAIEKIQKNIEDRLLYRKKRESIMAEANILAIATDAMPIVTIGLMYVAVPDIMKKYFESTQGIVILVGLVGIMLFGSVVIRKMLKQTTD